MAPIYADGQYVDTIALANFADYNYLDLYGDNKFRAVAGATQIDAKAQIEQGYTEQSNVNVISEMVSMINITRAYEAGQKMIQNTGFSGFRSLQMKLVKYNY